MRREGSSGTLEKGVKINDVQVSLRADGLHFSTYVKTQNFSNEYERLQPFWPLAFTPQPFIPFWYKRVFL